VANPLPPERLPRALAVINGWRSDPEAPAACPVCGAPGLTIIDQSARPYAEWYQLSCTACGLEHTVNIPLGPPVAGGMD
jgi:hypothetical protein